MALTTTSAISTSTVLGSLGVNTHLDFNAYGYQNLNTVISAINYLGLDNLRDSPNSPVDVGASGKWQIVANGTGAKFDAFMVEGSPTDDINGLARAKQIAAQGILNYLEGGNENDNADAIAKGNSIAWTANFQQQVYSTAHSLGLKAINMSFGSGWTWTNNWIGDYAKAGDLSAYADFANAHTYPGVGQSPDSVIEMLNSDAKLAASSRPVMITELGYNNSQFSTAASAGLTLDAVFDAIEDGDVKMYFYALFNDGSGQYGLMNQDGSPKPAGTAVHNLTTILGSSGTPKTDSLTYGLTGTTSGDHKLLMEKANGTFDLTLWNETDAAHNVTLTLGSTAQTVRIYDPLVGTSATATYSNTSTVTVNVPNHPVIVEIVPSGTATSSGGSTGTTTTSGSGTASDPRVIYGTDNADITVSSGTNKAYLLGSNGSITATGGSNTLYTNGTSNTITGGTGTDLIQAFNGGNVLKAGSGAETINVGGSGNTVYVGSSNHTVNDSGSNNKIVFSKAGNGATDIYGYVLANGDTLDLRTTLANTSWNKSSSTIGNFLKVGQSGTNAIVYVDPTGVAGGATYQLAVLHGAGSVSLSTLLAHSLTT